MNLIRALRNRVSATPEPPPSASAQPSYAASSIALRIHTPAGEHAYRAANPGKRVTDWLNSDEDLHVRDAAKGATPAADAWFTLPRREVLVVVPPEQPMDRSRRLHRPGQQIAIRVGPYVVTGAAHVPPGTDATAFLIRHRPQFVPLTGAVIEMVDGDRQTTHVPVAIVNVAQAGAVRRGS
jgi:hypothetical protein